MKTSQRLKSMPTYTRFFGVMAASIFLTACSFLGSNPENKPKEIDINVPLFSVHQSWAAKVGTTLKPPMVVHAQGHIITIASSDGEVVAIDANTGLQLWKKSLPETLVAGVGVDGEMAAVVSASNELIVLSSGQEQWRQRLNAPVFTAPLVAGGRVFLLTTDRNLIAFDAHSGKRLWGQAPATSNENLILQQAGVLTAANNTLIAGMHGRLAGVQPDTGTTLWETPLSIPRGTNEIERLVDLVGPVSKINGVLCARAFQSVVACLNATNGKMLWAQKSYGIHGVDGDEQAVYGTESNGVLVAWSRSNGSQLWSNDQLKYRKLSPPLVLGRSVIVGDSSGNLYFLSKTDGSLLNRIKTDDSGILAQPVIAGQTLVVTTAAGKVYGFRPE